MGYNSGRALPRTTTIEPVGSADPLIEVTPAPRFTRLEASYDRVAGMLKVPLRMPPD